MRRAARRDKSEGAIVKALRAAGASVTIIGQGDGIPDLLVGYRGVTLLFEVKLPLGPEGGRRAGGCSRPGMGGDGTLTRDQLDWWDGWRGRPPVIVRTPAEALVAIGFEPGAIEMLLLRPKPGPKPGQKVHAPVCRACFGAHRTSSCIDPGPRRM